MRLLHLIAAEDPTQTHHWMWPEKAEIIYGGIASILIFTALFKFAAPAAKKALAARTERIQKELDNAANTRSAAEAEASNIRRAIGDISGERARLMAEADQQAAALLSEGRARIVAEVADLEARADADIAAARSRSGDELRAQIAQIATAATQSAVSASLSDSTQQELIESFINSVGGAR
ncbi:MAG: synthase subunit [Actinomycetota bacterium]|jgi:F-type H+-transporting ATPase subunit b